MTPESLNKNNLENNEAPKVSSENIGEKEISLEEFLEIANIEEQNFKQETTNEIGKLNSINLDNQTFENIKNEIRVEIELNNLNQDAEKVIEDSKNQVAGAEIINEVEYSTEDDPRFRQMLEKEAYFRLKTYDKDYFDKNFSGLSEKGYLIDLDGKETMSMPSMNIGGQTGDLKYSEFINITKQKFLNEYPDAQEAEKNRLNSQKIKEDAEKAKEKVKIYDKPENDPTHIKALERIAYQEKLDKIMNREASYDYTEHEMNLFRNEFPEKAEAYFGKDSKANSPKINQVLESVVENSKNQITTTEVEESKNQDTRVEIKKEFIYQIINQENIRYKSEEAIERARRIDTDFPSTKTEKVFNKYKSQEKNINYLGHDSNIYIGDWLDEGAGGFYRKQPPLVSRKKDFIEVTNKANPDQITQILQHEYNHMFTQGHSNFSDKYQEYIRSIFFDEKELEVLSQNKDNEILSKEPYPGAGPVYKYLTTTGEINAYLGTNLRNDLLRNGLIKNFYDKVDKNVLEQALTIKDSNCNREKTPIYKIYLTIIKDKEKLINWLNNYAI